MAGDISRANGRKGGKPVGTATKLSRQKANELYAAGDDGLSGMLENMKFWRGKARDLGALVEDQLARMAVLTDADKIEDAIKEFSKTSNFFLAARDKYQECCVDMAPYTNPRLQAITIKKDTTHTEIRMTLAPAADEAERAYRDGTNIVPIKRPA